MYYQEKSYKMNLANRILFKLTLNIENSGSYLTPFSVGIALTLIPL